jgi:threonyl-tRNA synthetase
MLVVGDREAEHGQVALRRRAGASQEAHDLAAAVSLIAGQAAARALD